MTPGRSGSSSPSAAVVELEAVGAAGGGGGGGTDVIPVAGISLLGAASLLSQSGPSNDMIVIEFNYKREKQSQK
jgi:hypothetical protein